jgi:tRNA(His) guanylyltransferase
MKEKTMNIGDRIKQYEKVSHYKLLPREAVIIRIDGKSFHSFTAKMKKPFDEQLIEAMVRAGEQTAKEMMNFLLGFHQSDEFTFFLIDNATHETQAWFNNELNKIVSITASTFTAFFNREMGGTTAIFDARAFNCPIIDVPNVFIWRQRDWERNSLQMYCGSFYNHKEMHGKKMQEMHEMIFNKGKNWADLSDVLKNGTFITRDGIRINKKLNYEEISKQIS